MEKALKRKIESKLKRMRLHGVNEFALKKIAYEVERQVKGFLISPLADMTVIFSDEEINVKFERRDMYFNIHNGTMMRAGIIEERRMKFS